MAFATRQLTGGPAAPQPAGSLATANSLLQRRMCSALHQHVLQLFFDHHIARLEGCVSHPSLQELLSKQELFCSLFVEPILIPQALPLLAAAAAGPSDPLVPLQQQKGARTRQLAMSYRAAKDYIKTGVRTYLQYGSPREWQQQAAELHQQLAAGLDGEAEQPCGLSDMSALLLVDPVPTECLQGPEGWWTWHQALLGLQRCDVCDKEAEQVGQDCGRRVGLCWRVKLGLAKGSGLMGGHHSVMTLLGVTNAAALLSSTAFALLLLQQQKIGGYRYLVHGGVTSVASF